MILTDAFGRLIPGHWFTEAGGQTGRARFSSCNFVQEGLAMSTPKNVEAHVGLNKISHIIRTNRCLQRYEYFGRVRDNVSNGISVDYIATSKYAPFRHTGWFDGRTYTVIILTVSMNETAIIVLAMSVAILVHSLTQLISQFVFKKIGSTHLLATYWFQTWQAT